jgi:hypothetical protein
MIFPCLNLNLNQIENEKKFLFQIWPMGQKLCTWPKHIVNQPTWHGHCVGHGLALRGPQATGRPTEGARELASPVTGQRAHVHGEQH